MESWCPANPSVFRNIDLHARYIDKIPSWMISLGNLRGLDLSMCRMGPEDMANLGRIPALTSLKLGTFYGRNGRIFIHGFRYLKYFNLKLWSCGTAVEFEEGSMPKLEVFELHFAAHTMECVSFGIQHLSALTKVDLFIDGTDDIKNEIHGLMETSLGKLRSRPTLSLDGDGGHSSQSDCVHFEELFKGLYQQEAANSDQHIPGSDYFPFLGRIVEENNQDAKSCLRLLEEEHEVHH
ncbi:uncharacterized protein LOC119345226 [Triticum dicoccoides]|uniref:uncharacterized protein LOC119343069 n=1 Tax=Triticum dicoccoides TaxID=85692 RepID=UPI00188F117B|nr:uncharacterized protein LOC119343069 [Triticum dicoccoides]XP_037471281.1 uncharacterized protein LOC119345226 [Triticum dicoccoides]